MSWGNIMLYICFCCRIDFINCVFLCEKLSSILFYFLANWYLCKLLSNVDSFSIMYLFTKSSIESLQSRRHHLFHSLSLHKYQCVNPLICNSLNITFCTCGVHSFRFISFFPCIFSVVIISFLLASEIEIYFRLVRRFYCERDEYQNKTITAFIMMMHILIFNAINL